MYSSAEEGTALETFQRIFEELGKNVTLTVTSPITVYVTVSLTEIRCLLERKEIKDR